MRNTVNCIWGEFCRKFGCYYIWIKPPYPYSQWTLSKWYFVCCWFFLSRTFPLFHFYHHHRWRSSVYSTSVCQISWKKDGKAFNVQTFDTNTNEIFIFAWCFCFYFILFHFLLVSTAMALIKHKHKHIHFIVRNSNSFEFIAWKYWRARTHTVPLAAVDAKYFSLGVCAGWKWI